MAAPYTGILQRADTCSVCLELVDDTNQRSTARLICGHQFHLDCVGSAFNAKGSMECPNCRRIEDGKWLYANGSWRARLESPMFEEEMAFAVEFEMAAQMTEPILPANWRMMVDPILSRPYECSDEEVSMSLRYGDPDHPITPASEVANRLGGGDTFGSSLAHLLHGAPPPPPPQSAVPSSGQRIHQSPAAAAPPVAAVAGDGLLPLPSHGYQSVEQTPPLQQRQWRGERQGASTSAPSAGHPPAVLLGQMAPGWGYAGAPVVQDAMREEAELPTNNAQPPRMIQPRRRTARQHAAAEGPRWL